MPKSIDCIVCGSCVIDLLCRPADLSSAIGHGVLHLVDPLEVTTGGITSNSGITMARLGMSVSVLSYVGADPWADLIRSIYRREGLDDSLLMTHPSGATSTTVVMIDKSGERSFYHCVGAPKMLDKQALLSQIDTIARARMFLLGYYSLMPNLESDLPQVFAEFRRRGCRTALDAAGQGGAMQPLDRILPELDVYVPSLAEARHQTNESDPRRIIDIYRRCGAPGLLGVKLGKQGVLLSPKAGEFVEIPIATPPGPVVDTTGAGDSFYAGLLTGLLKGLSVADAGRLGAASGACCVTAVGGSTGGRDYAFTAQLAGL
jgi:sugar/nucleoside kinase (ribokinase family)